MLSTIIYRSHLSDDVQPDILPGLVAKATKLNALYGVTGILLFDGSHFFQLLEGPEEGVNTIYNRICQDDRHNNLVELMRDYAPARRFGNVGMELFDLQQYDEDSVLEAVLDKGTSKYKLTYEDRALQFLCTFVEAREKENYLEIPSADAWTFIASDAEAAMLESAETGSLDYSYAFQPIVDPLTRQVVSLEAELRSADGSPALKYFSQISGETVYEAELRSTQLAFAMAKKLGIGSKMLSIKLLPMSLVMVPNAVDYLLQEIHANGLVPEQIIIAVTENGVITREEEFAATIKQLKASGIRLAINDFGAGSAGLLLLTRVQPEQIVIDRNIISDVHKNGPKQAIVQAIIKFCSSLEISVIASGIEKAEEWMWLEAAGILNFQGALFSEPRLGGIPVVAWPEMD
ncbi:diguanylate phosphodiesterase [Rouxiella chamberiensis]|uniref:Diguanylate phosphodiesterase n=1 Tax=Rouxiella chamberiensis TaxID=1513468 RepID=A0ABY7HSS6_9GAMM|nr:diguanylate phosphodiesterase [Rouxiella chamberiensis]WAT02444.1 diguanylate phosphodiesterase [Rouxiella chamberiensis]